MFSEEQIKAAGSQEVPPSPSPNFMEIPPFLGRWLRLGLTEGDLHVLQNVILSNPTAGAVVAGTNGLRKIRFAAPGSGKGKSGSYRVLYLNVPGHGLVALWAVLGKTDADNFTKAERNILAGRVAAFLETLDEVLGERSRK